MKPPDGLLLILLLCCYRAAMVGWCREIQQRRVEDSGGRCQGVRRCELPFRRGGMVGSYVRFTSDLMLAFTFNVVICVASSDVCDDRVFRYVYSSWYRLSRCLYLMVVHGQDTPAKALFRFL